MQKDRIAILGDIHGNLEAFKAVLEKLSELEVTHYVCIGDIVGYNANPKECLDMLRELKPLGIVRGNHDEYVGTDQELIGFNPQAASAVEWTREQLDTADREWLAALPDESMIRRFGTGMKPFQIVHGTLDNPKMWGYIFTRLNAMASIEYQKCDICFCGHTHIPMYFVKDGETSAFLYEEDKPVIIHANVKYLFNVGSVGQPRDGDNRAAFLLYLPAENKVRLYRVPYDIETCQAKIRAAGLPDRLADRLEIGR